MREPRRRQQSAAAARNNVAPVARSTNLMDMPLDEFQGALAELAQQGVDTDALLRQYRSANSPVEGMSKAIFGTGFNSGAEAASAELAAAGRRPVAGSAGFLSRPIDGSGGVGLNIGGGLLGMLAGAGQAIDAPMAAYQGLMPEPDINFEALGTGSMAMLGGAAMTRPAGSLGMGGRESDFGKNWSDAYHWTRSQEPFEQFDPDKSTSAMSQLGPHVGTQSAAQSRTLAFPNETGTMMSLRANTEKPFLNPRTNEPWSEIGLESFISAFADEQGIDRRDAAPMMRQMLATEGYTDIPYINDIEDAGSISNIMLVDRPSGSDAVLRRSDAAFNPTRRTDPNLLAANRDQTTGLLGAVAAAEPRNTAERMARDILDMRAAGRAGEVTDEMMAQADPQYMYANTPLPMDEASRSARAREGGFDMSRPYIHGTAADFPAFKGDVWASEGNQLPAEYSSARRNMTGGDETFYPLTMRAGNAFESDRLPKTVTVGDFINEAIEQSPNVAAGQVNRDSVLENIGVIRAAARQEESGPHYGRNNFWNYPSELFGEKGAAAIGNVMDDLGFDSYRMIEGGEQTVGVRRPIDARSRFARFDPEFSHLSNLSAANIDPFAGLFGAMAAEEQRRKRNAP